MPFVNLFVLLIGFAVIAGLFVVGGLVVYLLARRLFTSEGLSQIDLTDGIDAREEAILRSLFAKQKAETDEAALKEKLAKVSGYELSE